MLSSTVPGLWEQYAGTYLNWYGESAASIFNEFTLPPRDLSEARNMGAIQHEAAKGCYCVDAYDYDESNYHRESSQHIRAISGESTLANAAYGITLADCNVLSTRSLESKYNGTDVITVQRSAPYTHLTKRSITAVYATGLSPSSTFNVAYNAYVQLAPRMSDDEYSALVPMLKQPLVSNPKAIIIAQLMQRQMPDMVPVGWNNKGDFWSTVFDSAMSVGANLLGSYLPAMAVPLVAGAVPAIKALASRLMKTEQKVNVLEGDRGGTIAALQSVGAMKSRNDQRPTLAQREAARRAKQRFLALQGRVGRQVNK
jgi:hypothetical protein